MIQISGLTRKYGDRTAVNNLTLDVRPGEVLAFLGPNGAGKTTTIKTVVGLLIPSSGTVRVCGVDVAEHPREASLHVGYVPDQPYLYEKLTGREFLEFTAEMYGLAPSVTASNIEQMIQAFALHDFVDQLAESYSHGMKQRVCFAAALVHGPSVIVLDEPMVGLDPRSMRIVKTLLRGQASRGASVFLSTHTLSVAEEIADRVGIVYQGKLQFVGTIHELRQHAKHREGSNLEELFLHLTAERRPSDPIGDAC